MSEKNEQSERFCAIIDLASVELDLMREKSKTPEEVIYLERPKLYYLEIQRLSALRDELNAIGKGSLQRDMQELEKAMKKETDRSPLFTALRELQQKRDDLVGDIEKAIRSLPVPEYFLHYVERKMAEYEKKLDAYDAADPQPNFSEMMPLLQWIGVADVTVNPALKFGSETRQKAARLVTRIYELQERETPRSLPPGDF